MSSVLRVTFKKNRFTFNLTANYDFFKVYVDQSFSKNEDNKEIESFKNWFFILQMGSNATKSDDLDSPSADQDHHSLWSDSGCNSSVISEMEPSPSELILEPQDFKVCNYNYFD